MVEFGLSQAIHATSVGLLLEAVLLVAICLPSYRYNKACPGWFQTVTLTCIIATRGERRRKRASPRKERGGEGRRPKGENRDHNSSKDKKGG